jgi:hypothetical protein
MQGKKRITEKKNAGQDAWLSPDISQPNASRPEIQEKNIIVCIQHIRGQAWHLPFTSCIFFLNRIRSSASGNN